ncbi:PAS domain S-box protein [Pacificimonas flava]|uniref:PAS domain S-box protein n=1 Tax=Pacificimonas flava TaxID=1234595 RepID=UPI0017DFC393|nr:PAS domain S-box protein [Pacificimonas flava]MBB5281837.1 PAS domain S-box-containing protein [Pacificimonas flava]
MDDEIPNSPALESDAWLAAIIGSSDDAIVSKTLDSIITSWNAGAERLFGYAPEEAIGKSIRIIIPEDRLSEEDMILGKLRNGERIEHFETVRRHKDGTLIEISVTVSPVRDAHGIVIGASKIARDIRERKRAEQQQRLLLQEMRHRVRNLFALVRGLVALSAKDTTSVADLQSNLSERLQSLLRAHELTLPDASGERARENAELRNLLEAVFAPYRDEARQDQVLIKSGPLSLTDAGLSSIALIFHELTTNAAKYGGLAVPNGQIEVIAGRCADKIKIRWRESGLCDLEQPQRGGFGSQLEQAMVEGMGAKLYRKWHSDGLEIVLEIPHQWFK